MSHPEIRVQYDAINAVIAAAQEILIKSAQPVAHEGHGRYSGVLTQAAPKGPLFRSSSLRKSVAFLSDQLDLAQPPFLGEERFERAVEAKQGEPAFVRHGLNP